MLAEQGQRLLLRQNAFQTREVAFAQGGKLLIGELKQLAGYADIVGKLVKQVVSCISGSWTCSRLWFVQVQRCVSKASSLVATRWLST